jgi:hypothetical protein
MKWNQPQTELQTDESNAVEPHAHVDHTHTVRAVTTTTLPQFTSAKEATPCL